MSNCEEGKSKMMMNMFNKLCGVLCTGVKRMMFQLKKYITRLNVLNFAGQLIWLPKTIDSIDNLDGLNFLNSSIFIV